MSKTIQLETLFDGGMITVKDKNIGGTLLTSAAIGKCMTFTGNNEMDVAGAGQSIDGKLISIDPKGDGTLIVQVTGYAEVPLKSGETITIGSTVAGYVVGAANGEAAACVALTIANTTSIAQIILPPRKVVSTRTGFVTIDLGAKMF
jgi:hypothetical protein